MAGIRPRDLLTDDLLGRLGRIPAAGAREVARALSRAITRLDGAGYLKIALPPEFGGLGCTLRQAACGQRRLARRAPLTALAVSAHLYWTGAAADAYRAGDDSARWVLLEAARGALFASGHGKPGSDLRFASPDSRCEPSGEMGYVFRNPSILSTVTPSWDWVAVHGITGDRRPDAVLAFAGRGSRCTPAFRVARVLSLGAPSDVFATSAVTWGNSILASVEYSHARRSFNDAVIAMDRQHDASAGIHPLDQWPVAEAGLRLDGMKATIAEITHPWPLIPEEGPDLGGQRLIAIHMMRHQVADGAAHVHRLVREMAASPAVAAL